MMANYKRWLSEFRDAQYLSARDLFLVTGTYMTRNWEAATFQRNLSSVGGDVTVDAVLAQGKMSIDWRTWKQTNCGFRLGHTHLGQDLPNHNSVPSFGACCNSCQQPPENQCIFLRGWQIREVFDFAKSQLAIPISMENLSSVEWRRAQLIRRSSSLFSSPMGAIRRRIQHPKPQNDAESSDRSPHLHTLVEAAGTPHSTAECVSHSLLTVPSTI